MGHFLTYHTHGCIRSFSPNPPTSGSSPSPSPSPNTHIKDTQTYAAFNARYKHTYPNHDNVHVGIIPHISPTPATPNSASLSAIILAQQEAIARFQNLKATNRDGEVWYLAVHSDEEFRAETNRGVGFYLDIYPDNEDVVSFINTWPFDDAKNELVPSKRLPDLELILQFGRLNERLHKLGQSSLGYYVKYHYIPRSENREVELDVIARLDEYALEMEVESKTLVTDEMKGELERIPTSKAMQKSTLTPKSTPAQKPKPRDPRLRQNPAPKMVKS